MEGNGVPVNPSLSGKRTRGGSLPEKKWEDWIRRKMKGVLGKIPSHKLSLGADRVPFRKQRY